MLSDGNRTFTWNAAGQLSSLAGAQGTTSYAYNGFGQRVRKTTGQKSRFFVYAEDGTSILGEYWQGAPGTPVGNVYEIVYLEGIPVAVMSGVQVYYVQTDQLNTPRIIKNAAGGVVWRWDSDPFGGGLANSNPSGLMQFEFNVRFPGQIYDAESGLHYNNARYYDAITGRYISSDPIGLAGGINTYGYVMGNPISFSDPTGLLCVCAYTKALDDNAQERSSGKCATYVRKALEAGGADTRNRPVAAKDYEALLTRNGFSEVSLASYTPQAGDTAVFSSYQGGSIYGHIQGYTGRSKSGWASDFKQPRFWANKGYEAANSFKVYRPVDTGSIEGGSCICR